MLFYNFYSKLKEAIGNNSLEELPPKKIKDPAMKIFMLMTLSNLDDKPTEYDTCLKTELRELKKWLESKLNSEGLDQLNDFINKLHDHPGKELSEYFEKILEDIRPAIEQCFNLHQKHSNDSNSIPNRFSSSDQFIEYLKYKCFWRSQKDDKFRKYRCGDNGITNIAIKISPYLVDFPHFTNVINDLKDDDKIKLYEQFKYDLTTVHFGNSLDFLGTDLANLLKKIIKEAAKDGSELKELEKLWKKEKENFLEMVFYPMLNYFISYERNFNYPYPIVLKILNENEGTIIEKHSNSFLLNLFFFISKKEQIFKYIKFKNISLNDICVFSPTTTRRICDYRKTSDSDIFGLSRYDEICAKEFFSKHCEMPNDHEPIFKDIKQILEFKNYVSSHAIMYIGTQHIGKDSYLGIKYNLFNNYYEDNKDKIDNAYEKTQDFWEKKKNTELFQLIREKLISEAEQNIRTRPDDSSVEEREFVDKNFKKLINYYLHGAIPQREYTLQEIMDR